MTATIDSTSEGTGLIEIVGMMAQGGAPSGKKVKKLLSKRPNV